MQLQVHILSAYTFRTVLVLITQLDSDISDWCQYESEHLVNLRSSVEYKNELLKYQNVNVNIANYISFNLMHEPASYISLLFVGKTDLASTNIK